LDEIDRRRHVRGDDRAVSVLVAFDVGLQGLEEALGMGRADDDAGHELAEGPVGEEKGEVEQELLARVADGREAGVLAEGDGLIDLDLDLLPDPFSGPCVLPSPDVPSFCGESGGKSIGWSRLKIKAKKEQKTLYKTRCGDIMILAFLRGLEKAPTFLVPIINPPFADNSPHFNPTADEVYKISVGREPSRARRGPDQSV
jgi:hypothetical protein